MEAVALSDANDLGQSKMPRGNKKLEGHYQGGEVVTGTPSRREQLLQGQFYRGEEVVTGDTTVEEHSSSGHYREEVVTGTLPWRSPPKLGEPKLGAVPKKDGGTRLIHALQSPMGIEFSLEHPHWPTTVYNSTLRLTHEALNLAVAGVQHALLHVSRSTQSAIVCNISPQELRLWNEVTELVETLQSESVVEQTVFLQAVFAALPASLQCHLLVHIADTTTDVLRQCRVMLLVLRRYPEHVPKRGVKLAESLLSAEKHSPLTSPVNRYRKYLVCDVLPLLLGCPQLQVSAKYLYRLLQKSIEFYVCYITQPTTSTDQLSSPGPELKSPSKPMQYGGSMFRRVSISGLSEKESCVTQPWHKLFDMVKAVGVLLHWKAGDLFEIVGPSGGPGEESQVVALRKRAKWWPWGKRAKWWPWGREPCGGPGEENQVVALGKRTKSSVYYDIWVGCLPQAKWWPWGSEPSGGPGEESQVVALGKRAKWSVYYDIWVGFPRPSGGPGEESQVVALRKRAKWWPWGREPSGGPGEESQVVALGKRTKWWPWGREAKWSVYYDIWVGCLPQAKWWPLGKRAKWWPWGREPSGGPGEGVVPVAVTVHPVRGRGGHIDPVLTPTIVCCSCQCQWQRLFTLYEGVGGHIASVLTPTIVCCSRQCQWQRLFTLYEGVGGHIDPGPHLKQVFYCALVLFFHCLLNYVAAVDPDQFIVLCCAPVTSAGCTPGQSRSTSSRQLC
ncbi:hypothetical protein LSAT2_009312 [Lamellibrachia satsuma]|nr:hypothetical protein LSAT2_009312 [Lamellibrachia satsuma]